MTLSLRSGNIRKFVLLSNSIHEYKPRNRNVHVVQRCTLPGLRRRSATQDYNVEALSLCIRRRGARFLVLLVDSREAVTEVIPKSSLKQHLASNGLQKMGNHVDVRGLQ